jgi:Cas6b C-terminal domain/Cas6b N-terminal domain
MTLRVLTVRFAATLTPDKLSAFRGALAAKVGLEHDLFHNHNNEEGASTAFHYRYPLMQYSLYMGQPVLTCIEEGIDEMQALFGQADWTLNLHGQPFPLTIDDLQIYEHTIAVAETPIYTYTIHNWQALNQKNYAEYQQLVGLVAKTEFLQQKLIAAILNFARGVDWFIEEKVTILIHEFGCHTRTYKRNTIVQTFEVQFSTNVKLPTHIGIGKGAALGFGRLSKGFPQPSNPMLST